MKKRIGILLCAIMVIKIGCDAQEETVNNPEAEKEYVKLAKEFEDDYLYKNRILAGAKKSQDSLLLSKERLEAIKNQNGFDKQKIEAFRDSVFLIAQQYGVTREDINLDEYFYINQQTGEIYSKDFFHKLFAHIKYTKKQLSDQQRKLKELERKYIPKIKEAKDSVKQRKLIEEYEKKMKEIKNSN